MNDIDQISLGVSTDSGHSGRVAILGIVFLLSTLFFGYALMSAPSTQGWGFLVANYISIMGLTQYGIAFTAIMRICGAKWSRPFYRMGELATLAFFPFAIIGLLYIFYGGSSYLFYWLHVGDDVHLIGWLDADWLLIRNLLALLVFYFVSLWYFMAGLLPDITEEDAKTGASWRQGLYRWMLGLKQKYGEERLKRIVYFYSPLVLVVAVIAQTFIVWDFAMMLVEHYHSTIFPMHYIVGNMFAGTAFLLLISRFLNKSVDVDRFFQRDQVHMAAVLMTAFMLLWLYMWWAQFFVSWYGALDVEYGTVSKWMYGHYAPYFWVQMIFLFFAPLACVIFIKFKQNWSAMLILALVINIGMWLNRYLIVIPGIADGHAAFSSMAEIAMTIGLISGFLFVWALLFDVFPMVSNWEIRAGAEDKLEIWK